MFPILATTERACVEIAASASISASVDANIYTGMDNDDKVAPAVICGALDAMQDFPESGIWRVKTQIVVKEVAADTDLTSSLANVIFEKFSTVTKEELSGSVENFSVYDIQLEGCTNSQQDDTWVQTLSLEIVGVLTD